MTDIDNRYLDEDHIQKLRPGGNFKYRVIGRHHSPIHHTNDPDDAKTYLAKCREYWIE